MVICLLLVLVPMDTCIVICVQTHYVPLSKEHWHTNVIASCILVWSPNSISFSSSKNFQPVWEHWPCLIEGTPKLLNTDSASNFKTASCPHWCSFDPKDLLHEYKAPILQEKSTFAVKGKTGKDLNFQQLLCTNQWGCVCLNEYGNSYKHIK